MSAYDRIAIKHAHRAMDIAAVAGPVVSTTLNPGRLPSLVRVEMATGVATHAIIVPGAQVLEDVSLNEIQISFSVHFTDVGSTLVITLPQTDSFFCYGGSTFTLTAAEDDDCQEITIQSPPRVVFDSDTSTALNPTEWTVVGAVDSEFPANGVSAFGYIYNTTAQSVAVEDPVLFSSTGPVSGGIAHTPAAAAVTVAAAGTYEINWSVTGAEINQFSIFVNGVASATTEYGSGAVNQQNNGQAILVLAAGDSLTLVNHTSAGAITLAATIGGTVATVSASMTIIRLV